MIINAGPAIVALKEKIGEATMKDMLAYHDMPVEAYEAHIRAAIKVLEDERGDVPIYNEDGHSNEEEK